MKILRYLSISPKSLVLSFIMPNYERTRYAMMQRKSWFAHACPTLNELVYPWYPLSYARNIQPYQTGQKDRV